MSEVRVTIVDADQPDLIGRSWTTDEEGNHHTVEDLTFRRVHDVNGARAARWHPGYPDGDETWTGADWATALAGEVGEACNVIKKLRRIDIGQPGTMDPPGDELAAMLADELADVFLYLDLLAGYYHVDLPAAIAHKFNVVSERQRFPERLP